MSMTMKRAAGTALPAVTIACLGGGHVAPATGEDWRLLVVYRGRHRPLCKANLKTLDAMLEDFVAIGVAVSVASGDRQEKAAADVAEHGWRFPVGFGMTVEQMRSLGLYVSAPRSAQETDRPFPEPCLFLINPTGEVQIADVSNAPFARPDLDGILRGVKLIQDRAYPIRGTHA